jgi:hypothetical protein
MLAFVKYTQDSMGPYPPKPEMLVVVPYLHVVPSSPRWTRLSDNALESVLVPLDGLGLVDLVRGADLALASSALGNALAGAGHADVEVHAVDTARISLCPTLTIRSPHTQCWGRT